MEVDMRLRPFVLLLLLLALGAGMFSVVAVEGQDDRPADRKAIRAHIDSIFEAFIKKDKAALRATHHQNWLGYLEGSETMIRGIDGYMNSIYVDSSSPYGMKSYKMREFDMIFKGDAAFVCFVADVVANTPVGMMKRTLRIADFYTKHGAQWIQSGSYTDLHPQSVEEQQQTLRILPDEEKKHLLDAREAVWRAYFSNDRATLEKLIPEETIAIGAGDNRWENRNAILEGSAQFAKGGGKLVRLEFPKTEIQVYGSTAMVYSDYLYELETGGQRHKQSGRVTELFVLRNGKWVNPGWHMDSMK